MAAAAEAVKIDASLTKEVMDVLEKYAYDPILRLSTHDTFRRFGDHCSGDAPFRIKKFTTSDGFFTKESKKKHKSMIALKKEEFEQNAKDAWERHVTTHHLNSIQSVFQKNSFIEKAMKESWNKFWWSLYDNKGELNSERKGNHHPDKVNYCFFDDSTDGYTAFTFFCATEKSSENLGWLRHYDAMKTAYEDEELLEVYDLFLEAWSQYFQPGKTIETGAETEVNLSGTDSKKVQELYEKWFSVSPSDIFTPETREEREQLEEIQDKWVWFSPNPGNARRERVGEADRPDLKKLEKEEKGKKDKKDKKKKGSRSKSPRRSNRDEDEKSD